MTTTRDDGEKTQRIHRIRLVFLLLSWQLFDLNQMLERLRNVLVRPGWLLFMFAVYLLSFVLKAAAWQAYVGREHAIGLYLHGNFLQLAVQPFAANQGW